MRIDDDFFVPQFLSPSTDVLDAHTVSYVLQIHPSVVPPTSPFFHICSVSDVLHELLLRNCDSRADEVDRGI